VFFDGILEKLVSGTAAGIVVQASAALIALALSLLLTNVLSLEAFGAYSNALAWIQILVVFASFGFPSLLVKEFAIARPSKSVGLYIRSLKFVFFAGVALSFTSLLVSSWVYTSEHQSQLIDTLWLAMPLVVLLTIMELSQAVLRGCSRIVEGQIARPLLLPIFMLGMSYCFHHLYMPLNAEIATVLYVLSAVLALVFSGMKARKYLVSGPDFAFDFREKKRAALHFFSVRGIDILISRADFILLGFLAGAKAVAIYAVADRIAVAVGIVRSAMNVPLQPMIAKSKANGKEERLKQIANLGATVSFVPSLFAAGVAALWGREILSFFGEEYVQAYWPLVVLSGCRLVSGFFGLVINLLTMTGHERSASHAKGLALLVNVILNLILIPQYGVLGAAIATLASFLTWNVFGALAVYRFLGLNSTLLNPYVLKRLIK